MKVSFQNVPLLYTIYFLSILLIFSGIKYCPQGNRNYLSKRNMDAIKGFSAIMIILHHISIIMVNVPILHILFKPVGAICCGAFLFCSGYGVCYSLENNGGGYLKSFLTKRIGKLLICFSVVFILDILLRMFVFGERYSLISILQCFFHLSFVRNEPSAQWFAVCIILFYLYFYIFAKTIKNQRLFYFLLTTFAPIYIVLCLLFDKESWWFNSAICLDVGILSYLNRGRIFKLYKRNKGYINCFYTILFCLIIFMGAYFICDNIVLIDEDTKHFLYVLYFNLLPSFANLFIIFFLLNFDFSKSIYRKLTPYSFDIYLLQNISLYMILGNNAGCKVKSSLIVLFHVLLTITLSVAVNKTGVVITKSILKSRCFISERINK